MLRTPVRTLCGMKGTMTMTIDEILVFHIAENISDAFSWYRTGDIVTAGYCLGCAQGRSNKIEDLQTAIRADKLIHVAMVAMKRKRVSP